MYDEYVSLRAFLRFFLSPSAPDALFFAVFLAAFEPSEVVFAGALEAVDAGALPAVEAGYQPNHVNLTSQTILSLI